MQEAFAGKLLESPEQLRDLSCVPKEISSEYQKLLSTNPARRLNPNKVRAQQSIAHARTLHVIWRMHQCKYLCATSDASVAKPQQSPKLACNSRLLKYGSVTVFPGENPY
jgi:hypothetical protein